MHTATNGSKKCLECALGRISAYGAAACDICPAGTYENSRTKCKPCDSGLYSTESGRFTIDTCVNCPIGTYSTAKGVSSLEGCNKCPPGRAAATEGNTAMSNCQQCELDKYNDEPGQSECKNCSAEETTTFRGATVCDRCQAGFYMTAAGSGSKGCASCGAGKISKYGASTCHDCGAGRFAGTGLGVGTTGNATECLTCPEGKWSDATLQTSSDTCKSCAAGKYSSARGVIAESGCNACSPGRASNVVGAGTSSTCKDCLPDYYANQPNQTSCDKCGDEGTSKAGATLCEKCSAGKYMYNSSEGKECRECPDGAVSVYGASACDVCGPGKYSAASKVFCILCSAGLWSDLAYQTSSEACKPCGGGTYSTAQGVGSEDECVLCAPGKFSAASGATAESTCKLCALDKYQDLSGQSECKTCPAGYTSTEQGSPNCLACSAGQYMHTATNGSKGCLKCNPGQVSSYGEDECTVCPAGTYANTANSSCIMCSPGRWSNKTSQYKDVCQGCGPGRFSMSSGTQQADDCIACSPGRASKSLGANSSAVCKACPEGKKAKMMGSLECAFCDPGRTSGEASSLCSPCSPGTKAVSNGSAPMCVDCPLGSYSLQSSEECISCDPGRYGVPDRTSCSLCPPGTYSTHVGGVDVSICESCPPGRYNAVPGASFLAGCQECAQGTFSSVAGANSSEACDLCPAGTACPSGSTKPTLCPPGEFSAISSPACSACTFGKFSNSNGTEVCKHCPKGTFQDEGRKTKCKLCPVDTYGVVIGASSQSDCAQCRMHLMNSGTHGVVGAKSPKQCLCLDGLGTGLKSGVIYPEHDPDTGYYPLRTDQSEFGNQSIAECKPCPRGAICLAPKYYIQMSREEAVNGSGAFLREFPPSEDYVVPLFGYRSPPWNKYLLAACEPPQACPGITNLSNPNLLQGVDTTGACSFGYDNTSILCSGCSTNFARASPEKPCQLCPPRDEVISIMAITFTLAFSVLSFIIKDSLDTCEELVHFGSTKFHTVGLRVVGSYIQLVSALLLVALPLPQTVENLLDTQSKVTNVGDVVMNIDCVFTARGGGTGSRVDYGTSEKQFVQKQAVFFSLPVIFMLGMLPFEMCHLLYVDWKKAHKKGKATKETNKVIPRQKCAVIDQERQERLKIMYEDRPATKSKSATKSKPATKSKQLKDVGAKNKEKESRHGNIVQSGSNLFSSVEKSAQSFLHEFVHEDGEHHASPIDKLIASSGILIYLLYPTIIKRFGMFFQCQQIGDRTHLSANLSTECYDDSHISMLLSIMLPSLFLWVIGPPFILIFVVYRLQKQEKLDPRSPTFSPSHVFRFGFYLAGYDHDHQWWEGLIMLRKLSMTLTMTMFGSVGSQLQIVSSIFFVTVSLFCQFSERPYTKRTHDWLEQASLTASWSLLFSLVFHSLDPDNFNAEVLSFCFVSITLIFFSVSACLFAWGMRYYPGKVGKIMRGCIQVSTCSRISFKGEFNRGAMGIVYAKKYVGRLRKKRKMRKEVITTETVLEANSKTAHSPKKIVRIPPKRRIKVKSPHSVDLDGSTVKLTQSTNMLDQMNPPAQALLEKPATSISELASQEPITSTQQSTEKEQVLLEKPATSVSELASQEPALSPVQHGTQEPMAAATQVASGKSLASPAQEHMETRQTLNLRTWNEI